VQAVQPSARQLEMLERIRGVLGPIPKAKAAKAEAAKAEAAKAEAAKAEPAKADRPKTERRQASAGAMRAAGERRTRTPAPR
jgi:hypothetical protein